jgi:hypothetical protein
MSSLNEISTYQLEMGETPAYGTIYRITGGFLYAPTSNLKRVTYWNDFQNYKVFSKKQAKTLSFIFSITRQQKIFKTISAYRKY